MGSVVRSIPWSLIYSNLPLRLTCAQPIRTCVRERLRLAAEIPLQIGRRGPDSEQTLTHLATLEGTEQREKQASAAELRLGRSPLCSFRRVALVRTAPSG